MKIDKSRRTRNKFVKTDTGEHRIAVKHSPFMDTLQRYDNIEHDLDCILEDIDELGRLLREKPTFINLKNYKAAVRSFLQAAVEHTYGVQERRFVDQHGRRRIYLLIAKIDDQLEQLTSLLMSKQASNLDLASKLDEIRGLLLDIKF
ncbi:MAG: YaaR family protein [Firmicutes bacterium]|nr:YaaR family protein [Bacillota bacterium]